MVNNGTLMALNGSLVLTGSLSGTGAVDFDYDTQAGTLSATGATLEVNGVSAGQTITMNGDDTLILSTPAAFAGAIAAKSGDKITLQGVTATSAVLTNGTLVVSNGATVVSSWHFPAATPETASLSADRPSRSLGGGCSGAYDHRCGRRPDGDGSDHYHAVLGGRDR